MILADTAHRAKSVIPPPPHVPWGHVWLLFLALPLLGVLIVANRRLKAGEPQTGGSGRVVGIVGRMGSGKSYMAVRMAIRRMKRGANVVTNFSMNLDPDRAYVNELAGRGLKPRAIVAELRTAAALLGFCGLLVEPPSLKRVRVLSGITGTWRMFRGWEQFAELENAVVIIDEAHLYAPSNKSLVFPDVARFKMSQARKFRLDVYWITQHENRVNAILKDLTNMMFVCRSWMTAAFFTVKGYEPEHMRKHGKHLERQGYRMNTAVAGLYNTLEILAADDHLMKSAGMARAHEVAAGYNAKVTKRPATVTEQVDTTGDIPDVVSDISAMPVVTKPVAVRGRMARCEHEQVKHTRAGTCKTCYPPPPKPARPPVRIRNGRVVTP